MKVRIAGIVAIIASAVLVACSGTGQPPPDKTSQQADKAAASYIVVLQDGVAPAEVSRMAFGLSHAPSHVYDKVLSGFATRLSSQEVARLQADPRVRWVEPDVVMTTTQGKGNGGGKGKDKNPPPPDDDPPPPDEDPPPPPDDGGDPPPPPGDDPPPPPDDDGGESTQKLGWGVDKIDAELNSGPGGAGITVAVLDTGIDLTHPDLAGAIVASFDATGSGSANDGNGHGTHVAGIIGARNNKFGYVGVAPKCNLAAVKVLSDNGSGMLSWIIAGLNWAVTNQATYNIRVANMSLTAKGHSSSLETAVNNTTAAGIVIVAGAGNASADAGEYMPARYANTLAVSAMTSSGSFASYSNWGSTIDLIAPGSSIPSLWKGGTYATKSGTSMAAPHVAGAVALWLDSNSGNFAAVKSALLASGKPGPWTGDPDGIAEPMVYARDL